MRWWWVCPYRDALMIMVTIKVILVMSSNLHISRCHRLWVHRGRGCHGGHISRHPCSSCHHLGGRMCYWLFAIMNFKTAVFLFPFSFKLHFSISFLDLLILQQLSFSSLHLIGSKQMRILCNANVRLVWVGPISPFCGDLYPLLPISLLWETPQVESWQ